MSDTKTGDDKTLSVNTKKTLTLKRPGMEQGTVRQNFSHGRVKSVVVETKKRKFCQARRQAGSRPRRGAVQAEAGPSPVAAAPGAGGAEAADCRRAACRHGAQRAVERRDGGAPPRARRLEGARGRRSPPRGRGRQAPRRGGRAPPPRARGIRAPPGRGGSAPAGRGRSPPPRRGRGAPPRAAGRGGNRRRRGRAKPSAPACADRSKRIVKPEVAKAVKAEGRRRPPPRQADAEHGAVRGGRARPLAVVDAPPPGEVQARAAPGAAREDRARSGAAGDHHHPGTGAAACRNARSTSSSSS